MAVDTANSRDDWEILASQSFVPVSVEGVAHRFTGTMERHEHGDAGLTRVRSDACEVVRSTSLIAHSAPDAVLFSLQLRGVNELAQDERRALVPPGHGALYFSDWPHHLRFPQTTDLAILQVPVAHVGIARRHLSSAVTRPLFSQASRAIKTYTRVVRSMFTERPMLESPADAIRVGTELLGHALRGQLGLAARPRSHDALLVAFRRHIQERLDDLSLGVPDLAAAEGVSVRTVHGVFAAAGTSPALFIRRARLEQAQRVLRLTHLTVADIAASCGFSDATTLTRAFKREFGMTPGTYRMEGDRD